MEWISVNQQTPPQGIKIKIKADYGNRSVEAEAVFTIYDIGEFNEAWGWSMSAEEQKKYGTANPTHWMPLPEPPKHTENPELDKKPK